ncbi:MAG: LamG-like jellyroll fold domain-containing protein [Planctomycetota bacterium]
MNVRTTSAGPAGVIAALGLALSPTSLPLAAQAPVRWLDPNTTTVAYSVTHGDHVEVFFTGFSTHGDRVPAGPVSLVVGVDPRPPISATPVAPPLVVNDDATGSELSEPLADAPLFDFGLQPNPAVTTYFNARYPGYDWTGFLATATPNVPSFRAVTFRLDVTMPWVPSHVAVAAAQLVNGSLVFSGQQIITVQSTRAATLLHYSFDRGAPGNDTINHAGGRGAPATSAMVGVGQTPWAPGRFGFALRGRADPLGNLGVSTCDTGWLGGLAGSLTVAWWMRERIDPGPASSSFFRIGAFRCFRDDSTGHGRLNCVGWAGGTESAPLTTDVATPARTRWVHVALVVDGDSSMRTATWFVDGVRADTHPIATPVSIPTGISPFVIGGGTAQRDATAYDIDEFRLCAFAATDSMVLGWARADAEPLAGTYGQTCGSALRARTQPALANIWRLAAEAPATSTLSPILGGALVPPFDLSLFHRPGCLLHTEPRFFLAPVAAAGEYTTLQLAIPDDVNLIGGPLSVQLVVVERTGNLRFSNSLAATLGR